MTGKLHFIDRCEVVIHHTDPVFDQFSDRTRLLGGVRQVNQIRNKRIGDGTILILMTPKVYSRRKEQPIREHKKRKGGQRRGVLTVVFANKKGLDRRHFLMGTLFLLRHLWLCVCLLATCVAEEQQAADRGKARGFGYREDDKSIWRGQFIIRLLSPVFSAVWWSG